jgi:hypothetical protein
MNLKPESIVEWGAPKGVSVVLKIDFSPGWIYITFLLPDNTLVEFSELIHLVDEEFPTL